MFVLVRKQCSIHIYFVIYKYDVYIGGQIRRNNKRIIILGIITTIPLKYNIIINHNIVLQNKSEIRTGNYNYDEEAFIRSHGVE